MSGHVVILFAKLQTVVLLLFKIFQVLFQQFLFFFTEVRLTEQLLELYDATEEYDHGDEKAEEGQDPSGTVEQVWENVWESAEADKCQKTELDDNLQIDFAQVFFPYDNGQRCQQKLDDDKRNSGDT